MPNLFVIAGPNGAGKSTSAPELFTGARRVDEFVNADVIASERGVSDIEAGQRVAARVRSGGHAIPEEVIRRRYERGLVNFFNAYAPAADSWILVDNTGRPPPRRIAWRNVGDRIYVGDNPAWTKLSARYMKPHVEEQKARLAPERAFTSEDLIDAIDRAVRAALARHKALGQSVVVWRDGKVVWLTPEEIEL